MRNVVRMVLFIAALFIAAVGPVYGQYAGPAILSRGEAPASISLPTIRFRPFVSVNEVYDTGLANVAVTDSGELASSASFGTRTSWGISGNHKWKETELGLNYFGNYTRYDRPTVPTGVDQSLLLGITHNLSRHMVFTARETGGIFTRDYTTGALAQTVQFDPSQSNIPTTDFFDNRTMYVTSQADLTIQKTARLSFDIGGEFFADVRRSKALANATGEGGRGDVQYRISRRITIGALYSFNHYAYSRTDGGTDAHGFAGSFSMRAARNLEITGYAGVYRVESKFLETLAIDPVVAALLGIQSTTQIFHTAGYHPNLNGRISRSFHNGVVYATMSHRISAGNGLFLTSYMTTATAGYSYTGLRYWSASVSGGGNWSHAEANLSGNYQGVTGSLAISRKLARSLHLTINASARQYGSGDFRNYNRLIYTATAGLTFAPGDVPLRIW